MLRWILSAFLFLACTSISLAQSTHRLHDGITAFVNNADGKDFDVHLAVRDLNLFETGPREVLVKVYDPAGTPVVRKVIPDDGIVSKAFLPPMGAWDHEAWYYAYCYMKGTQPMIRWSAFSEPDRLAAVAKRDFTFSVKGGKKGVYRVLIVGCIDHYVTLKIDPAMPHAIAGHPDWIHGQGKQLQKSYVYVPRGSIGMFAMFAEYDEPRKRTVSVRGPDDKELVTGKPGQMFWQDQVTFEKPGQYDDQVLTVEVGSGAGDFLLGLKFRLEKNSSVNYRGERIAPVVYAPDEATARAVQGGAIYHDGQVFWHGFQVRFHDWLKKRSPDDFEVKTADGKPADPAVGYYLKGAKGLVALPTRPNFLPVNGIYWRSPACDVIMHNYPAHKNKAALNVALRDLQAGLRGIGPHDHVSNAIGGSFANMAYEMGNYAWHYWRPAWRILRESDAPDDVKAIVQEAFLVTGDRLAFCRTWERVNGNAYAQLLAALRYCHAATNDPIQKELFETYWHRFTTGGWGERVGIGPSGPVQEGFGYDYHYASYIVSTWKAIRADFPDDERIAKVHDGVQRWFSYTRADESVAAGPWATRTSYAPVGLEPTEGPFVWKGLPGPDFTDSVNNADEFFAARRKNYYALTYHGRLSPKWESNAHPGQSGYGGGILCQLQIPGKGLAIASTLNASYGEGMDVSLWRDFHLHTLAGIQADGAPFVSGDSEHFDAKLKQNEVVSSGEIRNTPLRSRRTFSFKDDEIACSVQLDETSFGDLLNLWLKHKLRGKVREAYEMIPFQPNQRGKKGLTIVSLLDAEGKPGKALDKEPTEAAGVLIDRGGFGVRIIFDKARTVLRGNNNTVMIRLADKIVPAKEVTMSYRLVPFGN